ncbi:SDR family NAD(P)-dependent oxidoreductase [Modicisalibacter luteus]|uniref:SDR family NAD(P)-dependent oxidoreductase n=1 Tax=Modicisalibacter luteus TaxID=453962 RepID=A0ABV7LWC0_9GAMM|nr:SDR family NAD(P)-dependent oxidoreductase [Halomonas lutea]GHB11514.1 beta-ketoacyl-ACP reductase [Halomonas lutea]
MAKPLGGRVALVTGGSRNIGRAVALGLAEQGADVAIIASHHGQAMSDTLADIEALGRRGLGLAADIADSEAVEAAMAKVRETFGRLDTLVCCAAIRPHKPFAELTVEDWRKVMAVNLDGPFLAAKACLPLLLTSDQASIVTFGGASAHLGAAERANVIASKMGVVGLTRALAVEYGEQGVTANCIVPGQIDTERPAGSPAPSLKGGKGPLVGRFGRPDEVAALVCHLAGPSGRYCTGQTFHLNGGSYLG